MKTEELSNQERLELISDMIKQAKSHLVKTGGSSQLLLWGWVVSLANLGHFVLDIIGFYAPYITWLLVIPATIYSVYLGTKHAGGRVKSHLHSMYGHVWLSIGVLIFTSVLFMDKMSFNHNPVIMMSGAAGMYITGRLLQYKPVVWGSIVLFVAALIEWQIPISYQYLVSAIAVFIGYLVPGYMLRRSENG